MNPNLIPTNRRTKEEASELGRLGGMASGKSRRARKTFREALKNALGCSIPKDSPLYSRLKKQMKGLGIKGEPLVQDIPVLGMLMRAAKSENAFIAIRDTIGEKPVEAFEDVTPQSPVVLGMIPAELVKAAKEAKESREA